MFKQIFLPIIGVMLFIVFVGLLNQGKLNFLFAMPSPTPMPLTKTILIDNKEVVVEVARTATERSKGLSGRDFLDKNSGMVFIFAKDSKPIFWMKDTKFPLDIVWINDNKVVRIDKSVPTELSKKDSELTRYSTNVGIDYVLEVNAGFSEDNKIKVGSTVQKLSDL